MAQTIYASIDDLKAVIPVRDLVQLTNEDPSATTINEAPLSRHLADASLLIDAYLVSRFNLPFPEDGIPPVLRLLCVDITVYRLQALRPQHDMEDARKRYDDAIKSLDKIRTGALTLGLTPSGEIPSRSGITAETINGIEAVAQVIGAAQDLGVSSENLGRVFNRVTLQGY
jgi:phage gp36-like protein